jgi:hypothetical protein
VKFILNEEKAVESISAKKCTSCSGDMPSIGVRKIQLGQTGFLLGDLPNLIAGALEVEIFACAQCGKIELYQASFVYDSECFIASTVPYMQKEQSPF